MQRVVLVSAAALLVSLSVPRIGSAQSEETPEERDPSEGEDPADEDEDDDDDESRDLHTRDVVVYGTRLPDPDAAPVVAFRVDETELRRQQPLSVTDVLRRVPGVSVRDEEGMGLRPNIGFRGLSSDRSRNVLVLEDGVPTQMMPYDYPELYVAPRIERMRSVEVIRGAASILYGPRTIGGVVNFLTLEPPTELRLTGEARVGTDDYYFGFVTGGTTIGDLGVLVTAMHQRFQGPRHLELEQTDVMARLSLDLHDAGELRLKLQLYDENSASTQLGLTTTQFDSGNLDNFASNDRFPIRRYAAQLTHQIEISDDVSLATTGYFNVTTRDWWRQDFLRRSATGAPVDRFVDGLGRTLDPSAATPADDLGTSVFFLDSNVGRLRLYTVAGIEPRVTAHYDLGELSGEIVGGVRLHYEEGRDTDLAGSSPTARSGSLLASQSRSVMALAAYLRPTFELFDRRLEIAPGIRIESMWSSIRATQAITTAGGIIDGAYVPPTSETFDPAQSAQGNLVAVIPGVSATIRFDDALIAYGGVHRGFVPPGVRDAVLGYGRDVQLQPEYAWNFEWGLRGQPSTWLRYEATAFYVAYENQVLAPTEASSTAAGGLASAGSSTSYGIELSTRFDVASAASWGFELPVTFSYTYADSRFGPGWAAGISGNFVPYVAPHTLSTRIDFAHPIGIEAQASVDYVSAQYADPYETIDPSLDGTSGVIGPRAIVNARLGYTYAPWGATLFVDLRNALDTRYIASRAPAGIQPGMTRQIFVGLRLAY